MTEFFTSDTHFGHPLVASLRGFGTSREDADTDAHDQAVIDAWTRTVRPDDIVWVLGDLVGQNQRYQHALDILAALPGRKRLIYGNHDVGSSMRTKAHRYQAAYLAVFETAQDFATINVPRGGTQEQGVSSNSKALLSHYPYLGTGDDHTEVARYAQYRLPDHGTLLIHGHTHDPDQRVHFSDAGTTQVHVGLDAWDLTPVSMARLTRAIRAAEDIRAGAVDLDGTEALA